MKKLFVVAVLMVCAMIAYAQGASQALPVYVYRGNSILPTKTTIDLGNLAHPFDSVYAESGIFAIMFVDSLDVSMFLADGFDLGSGSFEEMWGTHFEADSAWIEYLGGGSPITLLDSLIGAYIQPDLLKAIDGLITQGSRAGAAVISNVDYPVALDDYTIIADTTVDLTFALPPLSSAWDTASMTGLEFNFYNQGTGILSILQNEADTLSLGGQDSMHLAQYSGLKLQAISDSLWAVFAGGGGGVGSGYDPDSLWFYRAFGDSITVLEGGALSFLGARDSLEYLNAYYVAGWNELSTQSSNYFNVNTSYSDYILTDVNVAVLNTGSPQVFGIAVYSDVDLGGDVIADTVITLPASIYPQSLSVLADSVELYSGSISVYIDGAAFRDYTLYVDYLSEYPAYDVSLFTNVMGEGWVPVPDLIPNAVVNGLRSITISGTTGSIVAVADSSAVLIDPGAPGGEGGSPGNLWLGSPAGNDSVTSWGPFFVRQVDDMGPMTDTPGTIGEIVFNLADTKFYGCVATGNPAVWAVFNVVLN